MKPLDSLPVTLLAIDPARTSGWCILTTPGALGASLSRTRALTMGMCQWGIARKAHERTVAIQAALDWTRQLKTTLIICAESWVGVGRLNATAVAGMGAAWGRWAEQLEMLQHPSRRVMRLDTGTWRAKAFGGRRRSGDWYKRQCISWCEARYDLTLPHDTAEAAVMGAMALRTEKIAELLPVKARRAQKARAI